MSIVVKMKEKTSSLKVESKLFTDYAVVGKLNKYTAHTSQNCKETKKLFVVRLNAHAQLLF